MTDNDLIYKLFPDYEKMYSQKQLSIKNAVKSFRNNVRKDAVKEVKDAVMSNAKINIYNLWKVEKIINKLIRK